MVQVGKSENILSMTISLFNYIQKSILIYSLLSIHCK